MPTATITLPAGIYDYTIDGVPGQATVFGAPDFYVDSINGSDSNDGLTSGTAFQTLSKAVTENDAMGDGTVVSLAGNSVWREAFTPAPNGLRIAWDGNGTPPVITGFDVQTGWVDDTATVAGRWYKDVAHDSNSTNRQVVIEDNAMMDRVDTAAEVTTAGTYYSANCGTANPIRVYINTGAENPNTNGKTYEVTTRLRAVYLQDNCSISGVVARGAITNNGPLEVGTGSNVTNCVAAFGTKHNFLIEDGVMTDVVAIDNDNSTPSEPTNTVGVAYAVDASSMNVTMRRVLVKSTREATGMFSHSTASPGNDHASITLDQCVFDMASGAAMTGGAQSITVSNCAAFGASLNGAMNVFAHSAFSVERTTAVINVDAVAIANSSATGDVTLSQSAITKTVTSGAQRLVAATSGRQITASNVSIDMPSGNFGFAYGWLSGTTGTLSLNNSLTVANNGVTIPSSANLTGDNNQYGSRNIGPFSNYRGTNYNLSSDIAGWRTATGADGASAAAINAFYTGTTSDGDFTTSGALAGSGVTEHWDFASQSVVNTPPTRLPVIPQTYAEAVTYISDPSAWNFYP